MGRVCATNFEKLNDFSQLDLLLLIASDKIEQRLCIEKLLGNDGIGLAECTDAHGPRINSHHVQYTIDRGNEARALAVEPKLLAVEQDKVELCPLHISG